MDEETTDGFTNYIKDGKVGQIIKKAMIALYEMPIKPTNIPEFLAMYFYDGAADLIHSSLLRAELCFKQDEVDNMRKQVKALTKRVDDLDSNIERMDDGSHFLFNFFLELLNTRVEKFNLLDRFLEDLERYPANLYPASPVTDNDEWDEMEGGEETGNKDCIPLQEVDSLFRLEIDARRMDPWGIVFPRKKTADFTGGRNNTAELSEPNNQLRAETSMDQFDYGDGDSIAEGLNVKAIASDHSHPELLRVLKPPKINMADLMGWTTYEASDSGEENYEGDETTEKIYNPEEIAEAADPVSSVNKELRSCVDDLDEGNLLNIDKIFGFEKAALSDFEDESYDFLDKFKDALERIKPKPEFSEPAEPDDNAIQGEKSQTTKSDPEPENMSMDTARPLKYTYNNHIHADSMFNAAAADFIEEESSHSLVGKQSFEFKHSMQPLVESSLKGKSTKSVRAVYSVRNVKGGTKSEITKQFVRGESLKPVVVNRGSLMSRFQNPNEIVSLSKPSFVQRESIDAKGSKELRKPSWNASKYQDGGNDVGKHKHNHYHHHHHHHHKHRDHEERKSKGNEEVKKCSGKQAKTIKTTPKPTVLPKIDDANKKKKKKERLSEMVDITTDYRAYLEQLKQEFNIGKTAVH